MTDAASTCSTRPSLYGNSQVDGRESSPSCDVADTAIDEFRVHLEKTRRFGRITGNTECTVRRRIISRASATVILYVKSLHQTTFSEYCYVNADLERTAVLGYDRMLELGRSVAEEAAIRWNVRRSHGTQNWSGARRVTDNPCL
jgi:hypothetical protein